MKLDRLTLIIGIGIGAAVSIAFFISMYYQSLSFVSAADRTGLFVYGIIKEISADTLVVDQNFGSSDYKGSPSVRRKLGQGTVFHNSGLSGQTNPSPQECSKALTVDRIAKGVQVCALTRIHENEFLGGLIWIDSACGPFQIPTTNEGKEESNITSSTIHIPKVESLESLEQRAVDYVLTTYSLEREIDKSVKVISSGYRTLYDQKIFYAEIQLLEDGKESTFYYNPKTDDFDTRLPSFEDVTGIINMTRDLWSKLQTVKSNEELQLIIYLGNLPENETERDSIVQDVIKQIKGLGPDGYFIQLKKPYNMGTSEVRIDAKAQAWTVEHLPQISHITKIGIESILTGS